MANPYYRKRAMDRVMQAGNYLNDAMEFLKQALRELDPLICQLCPKEAVYFYGGAQVCEEHVTKEIKEAQKVMQESKPKDSVIIDEVKETK